MSRRRTTEAGIVHGAALRAQAHGAERTGPRRLTWDLRRVPLPCVEPRFPPPLYANDEGTDRILLRDGRVSASWEVELVVRCRKCPNCLKVRSWEWARRARLECARWPNTLFGTLTLTPEWQLRASALASRRLLEDGIEPLAVDAGAFFKIKCAVIGEEITRYLKRCRKELGAPARFLLVAEHHKSGDPHFHLLWHEVFRPTADQWDTYRCLVDQWQGQIIDERPTGLGWAVWSGTDKSEHSKQSRYLCKYLAKSSLARVRASVRYGQLDDSQAVHPEVPL